MGTAVFLSGGCHDESFAEQAPRVCVGRGGGFSILQSLLTFLLCHMTLISRNDSGSPEKEADAVALSGLNR